MTAAFEVLPHAELDAPLPRRPSRQPARRLAAADPGDERTEPQRGRRTTDLRVPDRTRRRVLEVISIGSIPGGRGAVDVHAELGPAAEPSVLLARARRRRRGDQRVVGRRRHSRRPGGAPAPTPTPPANPGPPPGGPCNGSNPETIVSCERAKFGGMSHSQMFTFMESVAKSLNRKRHRRGTVRDPPQGWRRELQRVLVRCGLRRTGRWPAPVGRARRHRRRPDARLETHRGFDSRRRLRDSVTAIGVSVCSRVRGAGPSDALSDVLEPHPESAADLEPADRHGVVGAGEVGRAPRVARDARRRRSAA